jgi:hypothetical protein
VWCGAVRAASRGPRRRAHAERSGDGPGPAQVVRGDLHLRSVQRARQTGWGSGVRKGAKLTGLKSREHGTVHFSLSGTEGIAGFAV